MLDNATRRQLLERHKSSGFPGSIIDVYNAYNQGIDLISQFEMSNQPQMQVANTPQQQQEGLRPFHQQGQTNQSMVFPNVPPNTNFNTVGMKAPINIKKIDNQGNLVKSYENVPPGIQSLPTGPVGGTVIETPANMQSGGVRKYQAGNAMIDANGNPVSIALPPADITTDSKDNSFWEKVKRHNQLEDSGFEDVVEFFDPTGVSSWDDAYRARNSWKESGRTFPTFTEVGDMLSALPAANIIKGAKLGLTTIQKLNNIYARATKANDYINAAEDARQELIESKSNKKYGGVRKYQAGSSPDPDLAPGITQLPVADVQTDRVPYSKISDNSRMMGVGWAKPFFEAAGNNPDSKLYEIGQKILDEREQDLARAEMALEFTSVPGLMRTAERLKGKDPLRTIAKEGKLDLLSTLPLAGGMYKGLRLTEKAAGDLYNASKLGQTISSNLPDLNYAREFAKKYNYKSPSRRFAISTEKTNDAIRNLANQHNTFVRGVSTGWNNMPLDKKNLIFEQLKAAGIDPNNTEEVAKYMLTTVPGKTGYGRHGFDPDTAENIGALYTSNSIDTAKGYTYGDGYVGILRRKNLDFSGPRSQWLDKNDFNTLQTKLEDSNKVGIKKDFTATTIQRNPLDLAFPNARDRYVDSTADLSTQINQQYNNPISRRYFGKKLKEVKTKLEELGVDKLVSDANNYKMLVSTGQDVPDSVIKGLAKRIVETPSDYSGLQKTRFLGLPAGKNIDDLNTNELRKFIDLNVGRHTYYDEANFNNVINDVMKSGAFGIKPKLNNSYMRKIEKLSSKDFGKPNLRNLSKKFESNPYGHYVFQDKIGTQPVDLIELQNYTGKANELSRGHYGTGNKGFTQKQKGGVRKYQSGAKIDPFSPRAIAQQMADRFGGTADTYLALGDTVAYHESAHTMNPKMKQYDGGPGRGAFQIEPASMERLQNRVKAYANQHGYQVPSWINVPNNDARNLTLDQQMSLFLLDMAASSGTNMRAYAEGRSTTQEQWLKGWKRKPSQDGLDYQRFRTSANKAKAQGIPNASAMPSNIPPRITTRASATPKPGPRGVIEYDPSKLTLGSIIRLQ